MNPLIALAISASSLVGCFMFLSAGMPSLGLIAWVSLISAGAYFTAGGGIPGLVKPMASGTLGILLTAAILYAVALLGGGLAPLVLLVALLAFLIVMASGIQFFSFVPAAFMAASAYVGAGAKIEVAVYVILSWAAGLALCLGNRQSLESDDRSGASPSMKLHVLSDLHLSGEEFDAPAAEADVIVLAGDIARPAKACVWAQQLRKPVIYVAGNHEFYGGSIDGTVKAGTMRAGTNVHVLEADELIIDGVRFLGTTLWTDFLIFGEGAQRGQAMEEARTLIRDFSRIRADSSSDRAFSPDDAAVLFGRAVAWLQAKLTEPFDGPTVVVTHHAPSARSIHPRFLGSLLNACFVSDAEYLLNGDRVDLWIHGHTHDTFDYVVHGTRVVCNPRGYAKHGIDENAAFDSSLVVVV